MKSASARSTVALCVILGVALTLVYNRRPVVKLGNDQGAYVAWGRSMAGGPYADYGGSWPPLYPFVGSLFLRAGFSPLVSFHLTCLLSFVLLILLLFHLCERLDLGAAPVFTVVLCPAVFAYGWTEMSEMLFTLLATASLWFFLDSTDRKRAFLAALLMALSFETRYVGEFLIPAFGVVILLEYLANHAVSQKALTLALSVVGFGALFAFNAWQHPGHATGERPASHLGIATVLHDLGTAFWAVWIGDGPMAKLGWWSWPLAVASLVPVGYLLAVSLRSEPRVRVLGIGVICYVALLVAAECTVSLDGINRRLLVPIIALIVILSFDRFRKSRRFSVAVLTVSGLAAAAHAIKGRVL